MNPEQAKNLLAAKVKQVVDLARILHLKMEARQKIDNDGFIQLVIIFADEERYPAPVIVPAGPIPSGEVKVEVEPVPTGETGEHA